MNADHYSDLYQAQATGPLRSITHSQSSRDRGRLLELDLGALIGTLRQLRQSGRRPIDSVRPLLSILLTPNIDQGVDAICVKGLGVTWPARKVALGVR